MLETRAVGNQFPNNAITWTAQWSSILRITTTDMYIKKDPFLLHI